MRRFKAHKRVDKRIFHDTANKTKAKNLPGVQLTRGGYRL